MMELRTAPRPGDTREMTRQRGPLFGRQINGAAVPKRRLANPSCGGRFKPWLAPQHGRISSRSTKVLKV